VPGALRRVGIDTTDVARFELTEADRSTAVRFNALRVYGGLGYAIPAQVNLRSSLMTEQFHVKVAEWHRGRVALVVSRGSPILGSTCGKDTLPNRPSSSREYCVAPIPACTIPACRHE